MANALVASQSAQVRRRLPAEFACVRRFFASFVEHMSPLAWPVRMPLACVRRKRLDRGSLVAAILAVGVLADGISRAYTEGHHCD